MAAETKARKGDGENVGLQRSETRQMGAEGEGWVCSVAFQFLAHNKQ